MRPDKRKKRKRERIRRSKAWASRKRLQAQYDFEGDFRRLCQQEIQGHPSLLGIEELAEDGAARGLEGLELLQHFGYGEYTLHEWETNSSEGYYSSEHHRDGGFVLTVRDCKDDLRTVIFIRTRKGDKWALAGMNIAVLYHEVGHVDDIEKGINFKLDEPVDLTAAELYAHRFACKRMMQQNLQPPLAFYLTEFVDQLSRSEAVLVRAAASQFAESPEYSSLRSQNEVYVKAFES